MSNKQIKTMIFGIMWSIMVGNFLVAAADTNSDILTPQKKPILFTKDWGFKQKNLDEATHYFFNNSHPDGSVRLGKSFYTLLCAGAYMAYLGLDAPWNNKLNRGNFHSLSGRIATCYKKGLVYLFNGRDDCKSGMEELEEITKMANSRQGHHHPELATNLEKLYEYLLEHNIHNLTQDDIQQERIERKKYEEKSRMRTEMYFKEKQQQAKGF